MSNLIWNCFILFLRSAPIVRSRCLHYWPNNSLLRYVGCPQIHLDIHSHRDGGNLHLEVTHASAKNAVCTKHCLSSFDARCRHSPASLRGLGDASLLFLCVSLCVCLLPLVVAVVMPELSRAYLTTHLSNFVERVRR